LSSSLSVDPWSSIASFFGNNIQGLDLLLYPKFGTNLLEFLVTVV
jgi:hypothetical protein